MGMLIDLGKTKHFWDNGRHSSENIHNGLKLTESGWKNFNIKKRRRGGWRGNRCCVCGNRCYQSMGDLYEQICINCSEKFINNSIEELDKIKERLEEQRKHIKENNKEIMEHEKKKIDKWERLDLLNKLEDDNEI